MTAPVTRYTAAEMVVTADALDLIDTFPVSAQSAAANQRVIDAAAAMLRQAAAEGQELERRRASSRVNENEAQRRALLVR